MLNLSSCMVDSSFDNPVAHLLMFQKCFIDSVVFVHKAIFEIGKKRLGSSQYLFRNGGRYGGPDGSRVGARQTSYISGNYASNNYFAGYCTLRISSVFIYILLWKV